MDLVHETAGLLRELGRMKARDKARPKVDNYPVSGTYILPAMSASQSVKVTVTSSQLDWPTMSVRIYDLSASTYIDSPLHYKQTTSGLSRVNVFWIPIGSVASGRFRLEWTIIAQSPSTVTVGVE